MIKLDIHNRIRKERLDLKLTQEDLGNELGLSQQTISCYENGTLIPPADILVKLARIFNVSTDYLLGITNSFTDKNLIKISVNSKEYRLLTTYRKLGTDYKDIIWGDILKYQKIQEQSFVTNKKESNKKQA